MRLFLLFIVGALSAGCRSGCSGGTSDRSPAPDADQTVQEEAAAEAAAAPANRAWAQTFGGPSDDEALAVAASDELVVVAGTYSATAAFAGVDAVSRGGTDAFVVALTPSGAVRWVGTLGGAGGDSANGVAIRDDGAVVVTGRFEGTADLDPGEGTLRRSSAGDRDVFVVLVDRDGALLWAQAFGGPGWDEGHAVAVGRDGEVEVVGRFSSTVDFDTGDGEQRRVASGDVDAFALRLASDGSFGGVATFGGPGADVASGVATMPDGAVAVAGWFAETVDFDPREEGEAMRRSAGFSDIFVVSLDHDLGFRWAWTAGGQLVDQALAVAAEPEGALWVTGIFVDGATIRTPAEAIELRSVGRSDVFVARLEASGEPAWATSFGSTPADYGYGIALTTAGDALVTGRFAAEVDVDEASPGVELTTSGRSDAFVVAFGASGELRWARSFGGAGIDRGQAIAAAPDGAAIVAGAFEEQVDFTGAPLSDASLGARGASDAFIARLVP